MKFRHKRFKLIKGVPESWRKPMPRNAIQKSEKSEKKDSTAKKRGKSWPVGVEREFPKLASLAEHIADVACFQINRLAPAAGYDSKRMQYPKQATLEMLIRKLEARV